MSHAATRTQGGCPGARTMELNVEEETELQQGTRPSQLRQWPVQLHLVSPMAPYFQNADVLLAADCVAYTLGDFHKDHLAGHSLAIACPKLDSGQEVYREKLTALVDEAEINSLTVMIMQVPCCSGLLHLAKSAVDQASREIPIQFKVVGVRGEILQEGTF
jgi:hypothetical protein